MNEFFEPMKLWVPVLICALALWVLVRFLTPKLRARRATKRTSRKEGEVEVPNRAKGKVLFLAIAAIALIALVGYTIFMKKPPVPESSYSELTQAATSVEQETLGPWVDCLGKEKVAYIIPVGGTVRIATIDGMILDFTPYTTEGTLRACATHSPALCSENGKGFNARLNGILIRNVSAKPVPLRCWYY